jgi:nicotinamide mononucleotide transporter
MSTLTILDITGTIIGLVYLWLEYKASIHLWVVGIIMPAIYIFTYYKAGLYADFGINIYYFFAAIYGWLVWTFGKKHGQKEGEELPVTHASYKFMFKALVLFVVLWIIVALILIHFTNSTVPILDSFVNSLSIIGMWMLARKYAEQWITWIVVDAVCCGLYIYKGIPFTAGLYGVYAIVAIFGFLKWKKMIENEISDN